MTAFNSNSRSKIWRPLSYQTAKPAISSRHQTRPLVLVRFARPSRFVTVVVGTTDPELRSCSRTAFSHEIRAFRVDSRSRAGSSVGTRSMPLGQYFCSEPIGGVVARRLPMGNGCARCVPRTSEAAA